MRARAVRPNIYLPVVRFGVADSDWFSVLLISCASYLAPVPFGITILYVPLQLWTWLLATAGSVAFFNYIRIGRQPYWLPHRLKGVWSHHRQYRSLPNGRQRPFNRSWLIGSDRIEPETDLDASSRTSRPQTIVLLEDNHRVQEAWQETWDERLKLNWLMTD